MELRIVSEPSTMIGAGGIVTLKADWDSAPPIDVKYEWSIGGIEKGQCQLREDGPTAYWTTPKKAGVYTISLTASAGDKSWTAAQTFVVQPPNVSTPGSDRVRVAMQHAEVKATTDEVLWEAIRLGTERLSFDAFQRFIDAAFCGPAGRGVTSLGKDRFLPFSGVGAYERLKTATEVFLMTQCGVDPRESGIDMREWEAYTVDGDGADPDMIPYLALVRRKLKDETVRSEAGCDEGQANLCEGILRRKLVQPCFLELLWSYWHEEGMLVQTMNAISLRFQNRRNPYGRDPLVGFEIDPLRPLSNILWGYIQDEQHRLTVARRNYEYDHHYGLRLRGRAIPGEASAESRAKFLPAFHDLLRRCAAFFRQDDETTVIADGFPVLNALKATHLLLSEGAHNQYGDLPWTARQEMLMQQWVLARPELREFLPTRVMVAYPEAWMDRVEAMRKLQGWGDTSILHYRNLAKFGEQVLLSVRFGAWSDVNDRAQAANWARAWRSEIQGYVHAYEVVSGIDLSGGPADIVTQRGRRAALVAA